MGVETLHCWIIFWISICSLLPLSLQQHERASGRDKRWNFKAAYRSATPYALRPVMKTGNTGGFGSFRLTHMKKSSGLKGDNQSLNKKTPRLTRLPWRKIKEPVINSMEEWNDFPGGSPQLLWEGRIHMHANYVPKPFCKKKQKKKQNPANSCISYLLGLNIFAWQTWAMSFNMYTHTKLALQW